MRIRTLLAMFVAAPVLAAACLGGNDDGDPSSTLPPLPTLTPTLAGATPPPASPTVTAADPSSGMACAGREPLEVELASSVEDVMEGYDGTWGFAFYDLECETMTAVNGDYVQYPASASKIVSAIAAVRAVQDGRAAIEDVEPHLIEVFTWSSDHDADMLETFVTPDDLTAVLTDSGTSEASSIRETWHYTYMTAPDMARVWAALVRGELLGEEWTAYLLDKATLADVPEPYQTWPSADFELDGFEYGQKAGYWVSDGVPYHFVGAGYVMDLEDAANSFVPVVFMRANNPDLYDSQRRELWPLVVEHIQRVRGIEG